jgi:uncharacterized DUF497 family protein
MSTISRRTHAGSPKRTQTAIAEVENLRKVRKHQISKQVQVDDEKQIRIISARPAEVHEREEYEAER